MKPYVMVTGASRGIGAAVVRTLAKAGYPICINYMNAHKQALLLRDELVSLGNHTVAIQADVADCEAVERLFAEADESLGTLGGLVNNAGIIDKSGRFEDIDYLRLKKMFEVNVYGSFMCARQAVLRMSTRHGGQGGSIVNISSCAARIGSAFEFVHYASSKGAVDSMTFGLAKEVADEGIRVNAVRPGLIDTDIHEITGEPQRLERISAGVPMRRSGTAQEVADVVGWLFSDASSYVTGSLIDVSGGR